MAGDHRASTLVTHGLTTLGGLLRLELGAGRVAQNFPSALQRAKVSAPSEMLEDGSLWGRILL